MILINKHAENLQEQDKNTVMIMIEILDCGDD